MKMDPNVPSFFKIIISPSTDLHKLRIPPAFTKKHRSSFLDHAYIRAPESAEYRVDLSKKEDHVWFTNGWKDFADRYSLAFGHFLVFQYHGNSHFHLFIFDTSSIEINYTNFDAESSDQDEYENEEEGITHNEPDRGKKTMSFALERAMALKCENPHFIVTMSGSYLSDGRYRMWIPLHFARVHIDEKKTMRLQLESAARRAEEIWNVKISKGTKYIYLARGWDLFAVHNGLNVGDVCVFELIKPIDQTYRVHIFRLH